MTNELYKICMDVDNVGRGISGRFVFAGYALESVLRNKRRFLFGVVGIVLAVSMVSSSLIAVDTSATSAGQSIIKRVPVDFIDPSKLVGEATLNDSFISSRLAAIDSLEYVVGSEPLFSIGQCSYLNDSGGVFLAYPPANSIVFLRTNNAMILNSYSISGEPPTRGTVAVSMEVAMKLNLRIGDNMTCSFHWTYGSDLPSSPQVWVNLTFPISQIWTQNSRVVGSGLPYHPPSLYLSNGYSVALGSFWNPVVMNLADIGLVLDPLKASNNMSAPMTFAPFEFEYLIWVDREKVIDFADIKGTLNRMAYIQHRLAALSQSLDDTLLFAKESELAPSLRDLDTQLREMKFLFSSVSIPIYVLGVYVSFVGVNLSIDSRRKEIGLLKARGADRRQVLVSLVMESIVAGAIAGTVGLLVGLTLSRLLLSAVFSVPFSGEGMTVVDFPQVHLLTIITAIAVGVSLMLLSSLHTLNKISRIEVVEGLRHYSPATVEVHYKPYMDATVLAMACWSIISLYLGLGWPIGRGGSWIGGNLIHFFLSVGILVIPLMPFMLTISLVRLMTRSKRTLHARMASVVRPWTRELRSLVEKSIARNPRRTSALCIMISLALAFGIFVSVTMESSLNYERNLKRFAVGSDIQVEGWYGSSDREHFDDLAKLSSISGVSNSTIYEPISIVVDTYDSGRRDVNAVLMDSVNYSATVNPSSFYLSGSKDVTVKGLTTNGTVLVSHDFETENDILVGDKLRTHFVLQTVKNGTVSEDDWSFQLTVIGFVKGLPGLPNASLFLDFHTLHFIPRYELLQKISEVNAIVKLSDGANPYGIADGVEGVFLEAGLEPSAWILKDELAAMGRDPYFGPLSFFLYIESALSLLMISVGVGLLTIVTVSERESELVSLMARGASKTQIARLLGGESVSIMLSGLLVGVSVGLLSAYFMNQALANQVYTTTPREMILTNTTLILIATSIASLLVATMIGVSQVLRLNIAKLLRTRGG